MNNFNEWSREYQNASDKINTQLYTYMQNHGADLSCVKLYVRNNVEEVATYREKLKYKGASSGVVFTLDGTDYAILGSGYDALTEHVTLHVVVDNVKHVCDIMVDNGKEF